MAATLVYSTATRPTVRPVKKREKRERTCPDRSVEPHILGEFPMDCRRCNDHENLD